MQGNSIPNVVFIISDHHRWDYMGCAGSSFVHTPNLDGLASRGTLVERTYSTAPLCVPQRISLTAGRYCMNTGCFTNRHPVDPTIPTFLHSLQRRGARTAMIGKLHHHVHVFDDDFTKHEPDIHRLGYDLVHETSGKTGATGRKGGVIPCENQYTKFLRSIGLLEEYRAWTGRFGANDGISRPYEPWRWDADTTEDAYLAQEACRFLRRVPRDRPFYLHLGLAGPHPPFDAPEKFRRFYGADAEPPPAIGETRRDREAWLAYAACVTEVDEKVGHVLTALEREGLANNTVVLYTSDHGDVADDHGRWGKGNFYEGSVRVPFVAAGRGIPAGRRVKAMAELIDVGSTVCDFMGSHSHHFDQGRSLEPLLTGRNEEHREDVYSELGSDKMLFDGRYKLMYGDFTRDTRGEFNAPPMNGPAFGRPVTLPPDKISLYDLREDPSEENNLAEDLARSALLTEMKEKLLLRFIRNTQTILEDPGSVL